MIKLVAGLGNPGRKYDRTRHNLGFKVVDTIAGRYDSSFRKRKGEYRQSSVSIAGTNVILIKPITYMNLSGVAVVEAADYHGLEMSEILVVCDDINLPLGKIRVRSRGSDGGHKGLRSIIDETGSADFSRVRLGIGMPEDENKPVESFVLERFTGEEEDIVRQMIENAAEAVETVIKDGIDVAQQQFN
jgi:PTH1 family peptidyl-tRNA hydrolase